MPPLSKFYITFTFFAQKPRLLYIYDSRAVLHAASILPSLFSGCQACRQQRRHKTQCLASSYPPARIIYQTPMSVMSNPTEIFKVFPLLKSFFCIVLYFVCKHTSIYFFSLDSFWHSEVLKHVLQ